MINIPEIKVGQSFEPPIYVERRYKDENTPRSREYLKIISHLTNSEVYCLLITSINMGLTYRKLDYFNDSYYWNCREITEEEFKEHVEEYYKGLMK